MIFFLPTNSTKYGKAHANWMFVKQRMLKINRLFWDAKGHTTPPPFSRRWCLISRRKQEEKSGLKVGWDVAFAAGNALGEVKQLVHLLKLDH